MVWLRSTIRIDRRYRTSATGAAAASQRNDGNVRWSCSNQPTLTGSGVGAGFAAMTAGMANGVGAGRAQRPEAVSRETGPLSEVAYTRPQPYLAERTQQENAQTGEAGSSTGGVSRDEVDLVHEVPSDIADRRVTGSVDRGRSGGRDFADRMPRRALRRRRAGTGCLPGQPAPGTRGATQDLGVQLRSRHGHRNLPNAHCAFRWQTVTAWTPHRRGFDAQ